jgi:hypothetical protein
MRGIATVTLIVLLAGCAKKEAPPPVAEETTDIAATAREAAYPMPQLGAGTIQLARGGYRDSAAGLEVRMLASSVGDIDGDDRPDAAVVLASQTGGTGTFIDLYAVLDRGGSPQTRGPASLGDRVKVDSIRVSDRAVHLHVLTHAPNDPLCCPTRHEVETFVLHADTLMRRPAEQP